MNATTASRSCIASRVEPAAKMAKDAKAAKAAKNAKATGGRHQSEVPLFFPYFQPTTYDFGLTTDSQ